MTIYDYSDLLKMIANINTDKIIAKNERTMNNKNRLAKMENKLLKKMAKENIFKKGRYYD